MDENNVDISFFGLPRRFLIFLTSTCLVILLVVMVSSVCYSSKEVVTIEEEKSGGSIKLNFDSDYNTLSITDAFPIKDEVGMKSSFVYDFSVETKLEEASKIEYEVTIAKDEENSTIPDEYIKVYLEKEENGEYVRFFGPSVFSPLQVNSENGAKKGEMVIASVKKIKSGVDNYRLRIYLVENNAVRLGDYSVVVNINGSAK